MKKILIIISVAATLISCGGKEKTVDEIVAGNNLEEINAKKNELTAKQNAILDEIEKLEA